MTYSNTEALNAIADLLECLLGITKRKIMLVGNALIVLTSWLWDRSTAIIRAGKLIAQGVCTKLQYTAKWLYQKACVCKHYRTRRAASKFLAAEETTGSSSMLPIHTADLTGYTLSEFADQHGVSDACTQRIQ